MVAKITVIVPTYNRSAFIGECLRSLLTQTLPPHQILVVNDGSTDDTAALLRGFGDAISTIDTQNVGKPAAVNAGLRYASGDYAWIFDDDDVALPDALERFAQPFQEHPEIAFTYSSYWYTPTLDDGRIGVPVSRSYLPDVDKEDFFLRLLEVNFLGGAALFAKTDCYKAVGGFDPMLIRSQDYDMAIKIAWRFRGAQAPGGPTFYYRQHGGTRGGGGDRFEAKQRNLKWLEYDQIIFKRLYRELPLAAYRRPSQASRQHERVPLVQRAAIMASKNLLDELIADLEILSRGADQSALSPEERRLIVDVLAKTTWHGADPALSSRFISAARQMKRYSPVIREIHAEIGRSLFKGLVRGGRAAIARTVSGNHRKRQAAYRQLRIAWQRAARWLDR